ncbi:MAG: hypothetical protein HYX41_05240 [Bdellovibrio sp.]|nr:hypothetical protein [Bdellovibrio sp.]
MQQSQVSKDYGSYTKNPRRSPRSLPISEHELAHAIIPASEIRRAKRPISDYCKENNIGLTLDTNGHTVLRDKHYIVIQGEEAINTRNGTRGTLIDFVAAHHRLTLLQAVGKINGTTEPGLFEHHYGAIQRKYTPFYIPKPDQMPLTQATEHLSRFLKSHGGNAKMADDLLKHQRAEVSKTRAIRLFAENDPGGTLEFTEGPQNAWNEKKHGTFHRPFFQRPPKRNQMFLYLEPKAFLAGRGHAFNDRTHRDGILALMEPNKSQVDQYLKENPGVKKIQFVTPKHRSFTQPEIDFFGIMKHHLNPLGIECTTVSHERALSHEGLGLSI